MLELFWFDVLGLSLSSGRQMTSPHVAMQQDLQANGKKAKLAEPVVGSWGG